MNESDDARLFVELSSHAADLAEARDSLELALRSMRDPDSPLRAAERALVANASMAYCRTFFPSKVRGPVTALVDIPRAFAATHELVVRFRNRTIAHSQSDLSITYAVAVLDAATQEVLDVMGPSINSPIPSEHVHAFLNLVDTFARELEAVIDPIRTRLIDHLVAEHAAHLDGPRPTARMTPVDAFESRTTRNRYPLSHPIYLSRESGQ